MTTNRMYELPFRRPSGEIYGDETVHQWPAADPRQTEVIPVVFVVDSDTSARRFLEPLIRIQGWQPKMFTSAEEFLAVPRTAGPCCLLLDVKLQGLNGLELQERVSDRSNMPIIFVTGQIDVQTTVRAMKAGALEFLAKPARNEELLRAIRGALERSHAALSHDSALRALRERHGSLSPRERQVMKLVVSGFLNKQIAAKLSLSEITVKVYRGSMMRKMGPGSLADLVRMAARLGLTTIE